MNKKEKTMTASGAARELGVSRESVFALIRQGKLIRAGYAIRNGHRVALVTVESVLYEKTHRKAAKGWRDGGMRIDRTHTTKTRGRVQRIEKRGIPAAFDQADPSAVQTVTEIPAADSGAVRCESSERACRCYELACFWGAVFCAVCAGLCVILAAFKP